MESKYCVAVILAALSLSVGAAWSQSYPEKTVRVIVPYPPGGGVDLAARLVGQKLSEMWKQTVIVDNRTGAGGQIGIELVTRSTPDGYTLLMAASGQITIDVSLYSKLPYDPVKNLTPIALVAPTHYAVAIHPSVPAKSVKELLALARAKPGELTFGTAQGNPPHLAAELLKTLTGIKFTIVFYRGTGPALLDLVGGHITMMFPDLIAANPYIKSGRLRAVAVLSRNRLSSAPELPPISEVGVAGMDVIGWTGLFAPSGTPEAVINKINGDVLKTLELPEIKEKLAIGREFPDNSRQYFAAFIKSDTEKWRKVIKVSGARVD